MTIEKHIVSVRIWRLNIFSYLQPLSQTHLLSMKWTQQQICRGACQKKIILFGGKKKKFRGSMSRPQRQQSGQDCWPEILREKIIQNLFWQKKLNSPCRGKEAVVSHQSLCSVCQDQNSFTEFKGFIVKNHVGALLDLTCLCLEFLPHRQSLFLESHPLQQNASTASQGFRG